MTTRAALKQVLLRAKAIADSHCRHSGHLANFPERNSLETIFVNKRKRCFGNFLVIHSSQSVRPFQYFPLYCRTFSTTQAPITLDKKESESTLTAKMVRCTIHTIRDGTPYHFGEFLSFANRVGKLGPNVKKEGNDESHTQEIFFEGSALAGITAAVGLAGCSSGSQKEAPSEKQAESSPSTHNPVKTEDFDIVSCGFGNWPVPALPFALRRKALPSFASKKTLDSWAHLHSQKVSRASIQNSKLTREFRLIQYRSFPTL